MTFGFSSDGEPSPRDIVLGNAWCDDVAELTKVVQKLAPGNFRLPDRKSLSKPKGHVVVVPVEQFWPAE